MASNQPMAGWYNPIIEKIRNDEFPMVRETIYLDHAGTAIPPKSLMDKFANDMIQNLYGNPHSSSVAAQETSKKIENLRLRLLAFFNADPEVYDLVFVANATAGVKLVAESLKEFENGFWFGYHGASHTSVVGMRELSQRHRSFDSNEEVEDWLASDLIDEEATCSIALLAYPAQSNMNGTRYPLDWCERARNKPSRTTLTLLDAAGLASTSPLDLSKCQPDFTVLSLYKIFGFPDLGALIVRKDSRKVFDSRRYFGGGTVDMVTCGAQSSHAKKSHSIHEQLEDGSLPIHNIIALNAAFDTYATLFESLDRVSQHCAFLAQRLFLGLSSLRHSNEQKVCSLYHDTSCDFGNTNQQGPVIAFNIRDALGDWVGITEVEKLASIKNIQFRTGGLCNPGGVSRALGLSAEDIHKNYANGHRCGSGIDILHGRPTGMIRISVGPTNTMADIDLFLAFIQEFFVSANLLSHPDPQLVKEDAPAPYSVESLTVYPIKSCAGWTIPHDKPWIINREGLAWDREWCIILAGSGAVMNQKRYPRMALIHPVIDLDEGLLRVSYANHDMKLPPIVIPLYMKPCSSMEKDNRARNVRVCDDDIATRIYTAPDIVDFFTRALGVACFLGRFPAGATDVHGRHAKSNLHSSRTLHQKRHTGAIPGIVEKDRADRPILLSNESPVLTVSRSSLNRLNEQIKINGGRAVHAAAFRANIVVAETSPFSHRHAEKPYAEDEWRWMKIGSELFELLGPCRRCQMVCIDQNTGERHQEPFVTLAKTRRFDGMVFFGQHSCHVPNVDLQACSPSKTYLATISVGDAVLPIL